MNNYDTFKGNTDKTKAFEYIIRVALSCKTLEHIETCKKLIYNYEKLHNDNIADKFLM